MISSFHIIGSRQMGGAERFYIRLLKALKEKHQPITAIVRPSSPLRSALNTGIEQHLVPMRNGWDIFSLLSIRKLLKAHTPQVAQTYMGRATRLTRVPKELDTVHVARLGGYYKIKGYYEHAHFWVGNTKGLCNYLVQNGIPANKIYCIGNFVELPSLSSPESMHEARKSLGLPDEAFILFSLGRFNHKKGFETLLDAFAMIPPSLKSRPVFLLLAGDGPLAESLRKQALKLGIQEKIRWLGWVDDPGIFYDIADIFICPSREETLGNVILEAWAHALPVISTSTPGALELIQDKKNGLIVPIDSPAKLYHATVDLLKAGEALWNELGKNGLESVKKNHTKEAIVSAYLEMYREIVDNHNRDR